MGLRRKGGAQQAQGRCSLQHPSDFTALPVYCDAVMSHKKTCIALSTPKVMLRIRVRITAGVIRWLLLYLITVAEGPDANVRRYSTV